VGFGDGKTEGIELGDKEGMTEGLVVGRGVVGYKVGEFVGVGVGKQVSHFNSIHDSRSSNMPSEYTLHKDTSIGGVLSQSSGGSLYMAYTPPSPVITQLSSSAQ